MCKSIIAFSLNLHNRYHMNQKGFAYLYLILGALLLVLVGAGAYYLGTKNVQTQQQTVSPIVSQQTLTPAVDQTANWQTYTNSTFGFSIKYPLDLKMSGAKDDPRSILSVMFEKQVGANPDVVGSIAYWVELWVYPLDDTQDLKTWTTNDADQHLRQAFSTKQVSVFSYNENGLEGYTADGGQQWVAKYVWVYNNKYVFRFAVGDGDPNGDYRNNKEAQVVFNQILSTLTFTNQNQTSVSLAPADSKTPASGFCPDPPPGTVVTVTINPDVPSPRCQKVLANQQLRVVNNTSQTLTVSLGQNSLTIAPSQSQTITQTFGTYLASGVHHIITSSQLAQQGGAGPEIWLQ